MILVFEPMKLTIVLRPRWLFEISVEDKRILYSGDIRFHGRRAWRSRKLTSNIASPDYLLLEGSTLGRENQEQLTEYDIEKRLTEFFCRT